MVEYEFYEKQRLFLVREAVEYIEVRYDQCGRAN